MKRLWSSLEAIYGVRGSRTVNITLGLISSKLDHVPAYTHSAIRTLNQAAQETPIVFLTRRGRAFVVAANLAAKPCFNDQYYDVPLQIDDLASASEEVSAEWRAEFEDVRSRNTSSLADRDPDDTSDRTHERPAAGVGRHKPTLRARLDSGRLRRMP